MKLTIGKLAKLAGIEVDTIRYYEKIGLLPEPVRSGSGYRLYSFETISELRFIIRAKRLGFSLKEVRELLELRRSKKSEIHCDKVLGKARRKLSEIEEKLRELSAMRDELLSLIDECERREREDCCPILEALED